MLEKVDGAGNMGNVNEKQEKGLKFDRGSMEIRVLEIDRRGGEWDE